MAELSSKREDLEKYQEISQGLTDNTDLIDLVEMSENSESATLDQIENDLEKLKKEVSSMKLKTLSLIKTTPLCQLMQVLVV